MNFLWSYRNRPAHRSDSLYYVSKKTFFHQRPTNPIWTRCTLQQSLVFLHPSSIHGPSPLFAVCPRVKDVLTIDSVDLHRGKWCSLLNRFCFWNSKMKKIQIFVFYFQSFSWKTLWDLGESSPQSTALVWSFWSAASTSASVSLEISRFQNCKLWKCSGKKPTPKNKRKNRNASYMHSTTFPYAFA